MRQVKHINKPDTTHASLFSGFGAADLAAEWMGWANAFWCEIDPFPRRVLQYWFPNQIGYEDITKTDFTKWRGKIDVLTGGFPCQPFSVAGRRKGADDDRYLWPEMLRAIREIQPRWVVGENVAGILTMVQPGREIEVEHQASMFETVDKETLLEREYVVETVCRDLEREGYSVQPALIPACAVGAPHRRDRVFFIAHRADARAETVQCGRKDGVSAVGNAADTQRFGGREICNHLQSEATDGERANSDGCERPASNSDINRQRERAYQQVSVAGCKGASYDCTGGEDGATPHSNEYRSAPRKTCEGIERSRRGDVPQQGERRDTTQRSDGLLGLSWDATHAKCIGWCEGELHYGELAQLQQTECREIQSLRTDCPQDRWRHFPTQPPVCRGNDGLPFDVERLTLPFAKWRAGAVKGYGNAIVPQVMYEIFKAIEYAENKQLT